MCKLGSLPILISKLQRNTKGSGTGLQAGTLCVPLSSGPRMWLDEMGICTGSCRGRKCMASPGDPVGRASFSSLTTWSSGLSYSAGLSRLTHPGTPGSTSWVRWPERWPSSRRTHGASPRAGLIFGPGGKGPDRDVGFRVQKLQGQVGLLPSPTGCQCVDLG